jgi:maleylacetate reductase
MTAILYETDLTLDLPGPETAGTALNALAHSAEALYIAGTNDERVNDALAGAGLISTFLPIVLESPRSPAARRALLVGAMHAGSALRAGMGIGHAMAQALGGRFGLAHGTMNAVCLPHALRFNLPVAPRAIAYLSAAMGTADAVERVSELASLAGPGRLRDYGVPREELSAVASAAAERPAAKANPRPAPPEAILELLEAAW